MTIAQLEGGLASQMFGYAAARRLALRHGQRVLIDPRILRMDAKRQLELHHFDVQADLLTVEQANELCGETDQLVQTVRPRHLHFDRSIVDLDDPMVLMKGNYVSEQYFSDVSDVLRSDFTRLSTPTDYHRDVAEQVAGRLREGWQPVAVHVRRGDYVLEAHTNRFHGTCSTEYYARAFSNIRRMVRRPWFFVFSDDPGWCEGAFSPSQTTICHPSPESPPVEDMLLMASCRHQIIANSTYSWWAAWLGAHDSQVVIGPRPFIADRSFNTDDVMPAHWIALGA